MDKEKILKKAKEHVASTVTSLQKSNKKNKVSLKNSRKALALPDTDKILEENMIRFFEKRIKEIGYLEKSPYFVRCDVLWEGKSEIRSLYFAKFMFDKKNIYSWITPAASMRFEKVGDIQYKRPDGSMQKARLVRKNQYMIAESNITFFTTESLNAPRQLIYQKHFSHHKTEFILPEIVAQMEKAQDQIIRAHHRGAFLISGPAGSGKTTLALHRVAYLSSVPDLAEIYAPESIIIFVQDTGTKEYFSHLLPDLGIDDVKITTFVQWALSILDLKNIKVDRCGETEDEKDFYEFAKLHVIKNVDVVSCRKRNVYRILEKLYYPYFNDEQKRLFQVQENDKILDRIDLTILLYIHKQSKDCLGYIKEEWVELRNGLVKKRKKYVPFEYSLIVIDEFQNYIPNQLQLLTGCIDKKTQSVVYIGDMAQQVRLGTIQKWKDIDENIGKDRHVILQKIYRNTKSILKYIHALGYDVIIPDEVREGKAVEEHVFINMIEEQDYIAKFIKNANFSSIGILAREHTYLSHFTKEFKDNKLVHIMTMAHAQGVEFDIVFIVGIDEDMFIHSFDNNISYELIVEKKKINRDLLYIALTRAMSELHVLGRKKLSEINLEV